MSEKLVHFLHIHKCSASTLFYAYNSATPAPTLTYVWMQRSVGVDTNMSGWPFRTFWILPPSERTMSATLINYFFKHTANTNMTATPEIYLQSFNDNQEAGGWKTNAHWSCKHHAKITGPEYRTGHYFEFNLRRVPSIFDESAFRGTRNRIHLDFGYSS